MKKDGLKTYQERTFKRGSTTYFNSSLFFPAEMRAKVLTLYAFVRRADDFVDAVPQDEAGFRAFRSYYEAARAGSDPAAGDPPAPEDRAVADAFVALSREARFEDAWTDAFLDSMEADLSVAAYDDAESLLAYIYGSAEVIGLYMARLMDLPPEADSSARLLGRAMQMINFVRDAAEDARLGRRYLPLNGADPRVVDEAWARANPDAFGAWLRSSSALYRDWDRGASRGFRWMPYRCRIAVATAAALYRWTARTVEKRPLTVFERKVKPSKVRVVLCALGRAATGALR